MTTDTTMKAIGFITSLPIDHEESLELVNLEKPISTGYDVTVRINAVSVNPVDAKVRIRSANDELLETHKVVGFDAVGIIDSVGELVTDFKIGDRVYYAGDIRRPGSNAEYQSVDSRIIAKAPLTISDAAAAALPLTALTAWEALFDRLRVDPTEDSKNLLIIGGAGGVGSIATQIAKKITRLNVVSTAAREESKDWALKMGADSIANHRDLITSCRELGFESFDYIFNTADTAGHWDAMVELISPQGMICSIVETSEKIDLTKLQGKSAGFVWELMFTRSLFNTKDIKKQHDILKNVAELVDTGKLFSTMTTELNGFTVENHKEAHKRIESGSTIGKISINY